MDSDASNSDCEFEEISNDLWADGEFENFLDRRELVDPFVNEVLLNKDGTTKRVKRTDYSRSKKRPKCSDCWTDCLWLRMIKDPDTRNPRSREGKDFRKKFRTPFLVFEEIVQKCKDTELPEFNYAETTCAGEPSIPLELKVLTVLRILACGLHAWEEIISGFPGGESERVRYKSTDWIASVKKDVEC